MFLIVFLVWLKSKPYGNRTVCGFGSISNAVFDSSRGTTILQLVGARMNTRNQVDNTPPRVWKLDGTIPAWGLLVILFSMSSAWVGYSFNKMEDLEARILTREVSAAQYRDKVDQLQKKIEGFDTLKQDVGTLKELMIRVERKLDSLSK
jgi:hypothetical protein